MNERAEPFQITKQGVSKHIQVLESAALISRTRQGQTRPCHLEPLALEALTEWIDTYRLVAEGRFRRLDSLLETMKEKEQ